MPNFTFGPKAALPDDATFSAALGVNPAGRLTDFDLYKAVKLIGDSRYGLCEAGDDIEGVLISVEVNTVNAGYGFGTILCKDAVVASNAGAGAIAVGAYVVAAAQPAVGTALTRVTSGPLTGNLPTPVRVATALELEASNFKWRVTSLLGGNGGVGTPILIQRI